MEIITTAVEGEKQRKLVFMMKRIYEVCLRCLDEPVERKQPVEDQDSVNYCPGCGEKMTIIHIYEICPHCMDELIEREQSFEDRESNNYCPKCGRKLEVALMGDKIDDTTYKIILERASLTVYDRRVRFLEILKKMGNLSFNETLEKYKAKDSVIFEGDVREVYINMHLIDGFTDQIRYRVVPEFPFVISLTPFICICPDCGSDTVEKKGGIFCEKCNKWILLPPL